MKTSRKKKRLNHAMNKMTHKKHSRLKSGSSSSHRGLQHSQQHVDISGELNTLNTLLKSFINVGEDLSQPPKVSLHQAVEYLENIIKQLQETEKHMLSDRELAEDASLERLTSRELQILRLIAEGLANKNIASRLNISIRTVEAHRSHIIKKLGIKTTAALVKYAISNGLA
jgi:DNA-binding CsgD family transcriptional regulator